MTAIEWTDETWNPTVGCEIVSPGCAHCYAMAMARRCEAMGMAHYAGTTQVVNGHPVWTGRINPAPDSILAKPLGWRKPRRIFVNSMSDLFAEGVDDATIDRVFGVMAAASQHTYQVLTKRPQRMRAYMTGRDGPGMTPSRDHAEGLLERWRDAAETFAPTASVSLPLPHVWLGTSVERQREANARIAHLLATPAALRFLSCEPLIAPLDLAGMTWRDAVGVTHRGVLPDPSETDDYSYWAKQRAIRWVIAGGESGPGARPMHPDWARQLRDQCAAAGVPFFFKQWGAWSTLYDRDVEDPDWRRCDQFPRRFPRGRWLNAAGGHGFHGDRVCFAVPTSKAAAGRVLDGVTHDGFPA